MHLDLATKVEAGIDKLVNIGFVREVVHPIWLANVVQVKKKWQIRFYIDFRDFKKVSANMASRSDKRSCS